MTTKLLTFASLLAIALAAPAPANLNPPWTQGTCSFQATLNQDCNEVRGGLITQVQIPVIIDKDAKRIVTPNGGEPFIIDSTPYAIGIPDGKLGFSKLYITWDAAYGEGDHHGQVKWNYDGCPWWSHESHRNDCGVCRWEKWTGPEPVCSSSGDRAGTRSSVMVCDFKCGTPSEAGIDADEPTMSASYIQDPTVTTIRRPQPTRPTEGPTDKGNDDKPPVTNTGRAHPTRPTENLTGTATILVRV